MARGIRYKRLRNLTLTAAPGSFSMAGQSADLIKARHLVMTANTGVFQLSGHNANLSQQSHLLTAAAGSFAMTGNPVTFTKTTVSSNPFTNTRTSATFGSMQAAVNAAVAGDTITIASGTTTSGTNATCSITKNLTVTGLGTRPVLDAAGDSGPFAHGIFDVSNGVTLNVNNVWFKNASNGSSNGAGMWCGSTTILTCTDVKTTNCQNGIVTGNDVAGTGNGSVTLVRFEADHNGAGDGQSHGVYIGQIATATVSDSWFHGVATDGHQFKCRARVATIERSYFQDGTTDASSYLVDLPYGGDILLRGNCLQKGVNANNHLALVAYNADGEALPSDGRTNRLRMTHNTLCDNVGVPEWVIAPNGSFTITMTANLLCGGTVALSGGGFPPASVTSTSNVTMTAAELIDPTNTTTPNFAPTEAAMIKVPLTTVPDATYTLDSAGPLSNRTLRNMLRWAGALQRWQDAARPAWRTGLAANTWLFFANTDLATLGGGGITAYSGGTIRLRNRLLAWGGGDNDGSWNGVLELNLLSATPAWVIRGAASANQTSIAGSAYLSDGKPAARHTYGAVNFRDYEDSMVSIGCAFRYGGGASDGDPCFKTVDRFHANTGLWDAAGTMSNMPWSAPIDCGGDSTAHDWFGNLYLWSRQGPSTIYKLPANTTTTVSGTNAGAQNQNVGMTYDGFHNWLVQFGPSPARYDLSNGMARTAISFTGNATGIAVAQGHSYWCYVPELRAHLGIDDGEGGFTSQLWKCDDTTFDIQPYTVANTAGFGAVNADGALQYHGRFGYSYELQVMFLVPRSNKNVAVFSPI